MTIRNVNFWVSIDCTDLEMMILKKVSWKQLYHKFYAEICKKKLKWFQEADVILIVSFGIFIESLTLFRKQL